MVGIVVRVILNGIALWITTLFVTEVSFGQDPSVGSILLVAIIFGIVNALVKPILKLLTLPLTVMTLGLFGLVVNGALLLIVAWISGLIGADFSVGGYPPDFGLSAIWWAIVGAIVLGIVSAVLNLLPLPGDNA
jgi:putative membrane protein